MQVALLPSQFFENADYFNFPHPRNGKNATFIIKNDIIYELLKVDRPHSSWFVGKAVISNGVPLFAVPIHPMLLVLPFVSSRRKEMFSENDFFIDTPYMEIAKQLKPHLKYICQTMELGGEIKYNYDQKTTLSWLISKTEKLMPFLKKSNDLPDHLLIEVSFDVLRHYISSDFATLLMDELRQKYPGSFPPKNLNLGGIQDEYQQPPPPPPPPPKKKSTASKLKKPANNMSILSFCSPAKSQKKD